MQLDRTLVAIRARSFSELGDLTLMVLRQYPQALLIGFAVGALPWMCLDLLLLGWLPWSELGEAFADEETIANRYRYIWWMSMLVFLQAPLAGVFATYYVGQAVFTERPPWSSVFGNTLKRTVSLLWVLGVLRGAIPAMVLGLLIFGQDFSPGIEVFLLGLLCTVVALIRAFRPFTPEIMVLERCPLRGNKSGAISVGTRSGLLHGPLGGELMGRFVLASFVACFLAATLFYGSTWLVWQLFNSIDWSLLDTMVLLPLCLWSAAGLMTILRFLSYLDARIKLEGWEVELMLRAEEQRQFGEVALERTSRRGATEGVGSGASPSEATLQEASP